jgi:TRAP-type mannitol/chloroaromatic compound transport system permease large subunit
LIAILRYAGATQSADLAPHPVDGDVGLPPEGRRAEVVLLWSIFQGCFPFLGLVFVTMFLVYVFPQLVYWLPNVFYGS